jgi:hypothetical protein
MIWNLFRRPRQSRRPRPAARPARFRPAVETLEDRRLLAPVPVLFNLTPSLSALTISGNVTVMGITADFQPQRTSPFSSLRSTYTGTILTLYDPSARTIQFQNQCTLLDASVFPGGALNPAVGGGAGSAPADYGAFVSFRLGLLEIEHADAAFRDVTASLANPAPVALSGSGTTLSFPSTQNLTLTGGFIDYNATGVTTASGRESIAGNTRANTAANGTFQDQGGGNFRIVVPVAVTIQDTLGTTPFTLNINGQLEGTGRVVPLSVCSLTPTPTGFVAQFNGPFDPAQLNLYDSATGALGPADVVLNGPSGPVSGTLIPNANNTAVTFVATAGVLPAGNYSVTLRSAANGFRDTTGPLDGDGDGTPGGDFLRSFTVAASSARVVSVPSFARGPGQMVNVPATTAGLPIVLSDGNGVNSINFDLRYNPNLLTISSAAPGSGLPAGAQIALENPAPGVAHVIIASPSTPLSAGPAELVRLTASVPDMAGYTAKHVLDLANININGGTIPAIDSDGVAVVGYFGDITANGTYSSLDATRALQAAVGLGTGFDTYQLADPLITADITGNGILNATDATRILQFAIGQAVPQIPPLPDSPPMITQSGPDPVLSIPRKLVAGRGGTITVPVNLDRSDGLESVDLAISFDPRRLEVFANGGVRRGSLTGDFDLFGVNLDNETGTIRVGLGRTAGPLAGRGSGSVLQITFHVKRSAPRGATIINLRQNINQTLTALNDGGLDLVPDPSNRAGDALDGRLLIVRRLPPPPPGNPVVTLNQVAAVLVKQSTAPPVGNPPADPAPANRPAPVEQVPQVPANPPVIQAVATAPAESAAAPVREGVPSVVLDDPLSPPNGAE